MSQKKMHIKWLDLYGVVYVYYTKQLAYLNLKIEKKKKIIIFTDLLYKFINDDSKKFNQGECKQEIVYVFENLYQTRLLTKTFILNKIGLDVDNVDLYFLKK